MMKNEELGKANVKKITTAADIYSFAVMLYMLFIEEKEDINLEKITIENVIKRLNLLFTNDEVSGISREIVKDLTGIIENCLNKDPESRDTAQDLLFHHVFFSKET